MRTLLLNIESIGRTDNRAPRTASSRQHLVAEFVRGAKTIDSMGRTTAKRAGFHQYRAHFQAPAGSQPNAYDVRIQTVGERTLKQDGRNRELSIFKKESYFSFVQPSARAGRKFGLTFLHHHFFVSPSLYYYFIIIQHHPVPSCKTINYAIKMATLKSGSCSVQG
jgi:hypothetical protein